MSLRAVFWLTSALLSVLLLGLLGRVLEVDWDRLRASSAALVAAQRMEQSLQVAELASRERGPVVALFGAKAGEGVDNRARLQRARHLTDQSFARLDALLDPRDPDAAGARAEFDAAASALVAARAGVDRLCDLPLSARDPGALREAIARMFDAIDAMRAPQARLSNAALAAYPEAARELTGARLASELREYAGRVGSLITVALARQHPLAIAERAELERLDGRIAELHEQLQLRTRVLEHSPEVAAAMADMDRRYFASAVPFNRELIMAGAATGHYGIDTVAYVPSYVTDMDSIIRVRDALLSRALGLARTGDAEARMTLGWMGATAALTLLLLGLMLWVLHFRVIAPLNRITRWLGTLASGAYDEALPLPDRHDELTAILHAIEEMRHHSLARRALESERQQLIAQLLDQSNTDALTGLANRRGFLAQAALHIPHGRRPRRDLTLIVFDIDHFKRVNDRHGHPVGDAVLKSLAETCRRLCRSGDVVARLGGEEFVVLMPDCPLESGVVHAERLRIGISDMRMDLPSGGLLQVTASFGVTACRPDDSSIDQLIARADQRLYAAKHGGRNRVCAADPGPPDAAARSAGRS